MANKRASRVLMTGLFRASHPHFLEARPYMEDGKPKGEPQFSTEMLFEPEQLKEFQIWNDDNDEFVKVDINQIVLEVAKEEWPGIDVKAEFTGKWPIKSGDAKAKAREAAGKKGDVYEGMKVIRAKSYENEKVPPPGLYFTKDGKRVEVNRGMPSEVKAAGNIFRAGNYFYAEVTVMATESGGNKYVTFYLNSVLFAKEGPRIGGAGLMGRFDGVVGGVDEHDPTAGMDSSGDLDEEIPF